MKRVSGNAFHWAPGALKGPYGGVPRAAVVGVPTLSYGFVIMISGNTRARCLTTFKTVCVYIPLVFCSTIDTAMY